MTTEQQKAAADLSTIKAALDSTKTNNKLLQWLFLLSGINNIFHLLSTSLVIIFVSNFSTIGIMYSIIDIVCYTFIAVVAFKITHIARRSSNKYYITFFTIYSAVVILIPLIFLLTRLLSLKVATDQNATLLTLNQLSIFLYMALFSGSLITVSVLENVRSLSVAGILNIMIYLFLYVSEKSYIWGEKKYDLMAQLETLFSDYSDIYYNVVMSLGYIILGIYLLKISKRNNYEKK